MPHTCGTGSSSPNEENISVPLCNGEAEIEKKMLEDHPRANPLFASAGSSLVEFFFKSPENRNKSKISNIPPKTL